MDNIANTMHNIAEINRAALRWLQAKELRKKYPNDADFGHEVAKLIMNDE